MIDPRLRAIANKIGMRLVASRSPRNSKYAMWNGKSLGCKGMPFAHILHDICHFIVAPPERRCLPDYGLGAGPETVGYSAQATDPVIPEAQAEEEEGLVCALEYAYNQAFGVDGEYVKTSYGMSVREIKEAWVLLHRAGHLDADYQPTII